jgi:hypothetical protein
VSSGEQWEGIVHEYRNDWLEEFVGGPVIVSHLMPPPWSKDGDETKADANAANMEADPMYVIADNLDGMKGSYVLVDYDGIGVQLRTLDERSEIFFTPWSAVIRIEPGFEAHASLLRNLRELRGRGKRG